MDNFKININRPSEAEKLYNFFEKIPSLGNNTVFAVSQMTKICEKMNEELNNIKDEQTNYEMDMAEEYADLLAEQAEIEEKMITLNKEIKDLEQKEKDGTITDEEQKELKTKRGELTNLFKSSKQDEMNDLINESEQKSNNLNNKLEVAQDFGEVTQEKGQVLADTKVKRATWFRRLFGVTKRQKERKAIGEKAVEIAKTLIETVKNFFIKEPPKMETPQLNVGQPTSNTNVNVKFNTNQTFEVKPTNTNSKTLATEETSNNDKAFTAEDTQSVTVVEAEKSSETVAEKETEKNKKEVKEIQN